LQLVGATHPPSTQVSPMAHARPQPPQSFGSVDVSRQPSAQHVAPRAQPGPPLQLTAQVPDEQLDPGAHTIPQPPQSVASLVVSTQVTPQQVRPGEQPVVSQLVWFGWHTPETQVALAPQALAQVPQSFGSVSVFTSQPSATWWLQSAKPGVQEVMAQADASHEVWPLGTAPHATPHAPQFLSSLVVFAQVAPQQVWPAVHEAEGLQVPTQVPPEHAGRDAGQTLPQPPQLFGSSPVLVSQPFATTPSQSAKPGTHPAMSHADEAQPAIAFANGPQALPHAPQSSGLVAVLTQSGEQQVRPSAQAPPPPQKPTHWKLEHSSPEGHWPLVTHSAQVMVSRRQCGVGAAHCASEVQPRGVGTHACVVGLHCSPPGQSALVVHPPGRAPPVPAAPPVSEKTPIGVRPHAATVVAATSSKMAWTAPVSLVIEGSS
jgi:hypothetical protein